MDQAKPIASAVAIKDGVFSAVGSDHEVIALAFTRTRLIDLKGNECCLACATTICTLRGGLR